VSLLWDEFIITDACSYGMSYGSGCAYDWECRSILTWMQTSWLTHASCTTPSHAEDVSANCDRKHVMSSLGHCRLHQKYYFL